MADQARKLGLASGQRIAFFGSQPASTALINAAAPDSCSFEQFDEAQSYPLIFFCPQMLEGLAVVFADTQRHLTMDGVVWAVLPKAIYARIRGGAVTWLEVLPTALTTDLVDNKKVSLSAEEYATRFVIRKTARSDR